MSLRFDDVIALSQAKLEELFRTSKGPELAAISGREFNGYNLTVMAELIGVRKFRKGFFDPDGHLSSRGEIEGYNIPIRQNKVDQPWQGKPSDADAKRFGFYIVAPAARDPKHNRYANALLLHYGNSPRNAFYRPERMLRDYLVQVNEGSSDLLLGKAYFDIGVATVPANFFVLKAVGTP